MLREHYGRWDGAKGYGKNFWRRELRIKTINLSSDRKREGAAENAGAKEVQGQGPEYKRKAQHIEEIKGFSVAETQSGAKREGSRERFRDRSHRVCMGFDLLAMENGEPLKVFSARRKNTQT